MHLVEDEDARKALDDALEKWSGTAVAWEAATWVILRERDKGVPISEDGNVRVFVYHGAKSIKQPTITLIYEIDGRETIIRSARFEEPINAQAGNA